MKKSIITLFAVISICLISCNNNNNTTIKPSQGTLTVTYDGNTYMLDSAYYTIQSQNADLTITQLRIYGLDVNSNPSVGDFLQFDCFPANGSELYNTYWSFNFGIHCRLNSSLITNNNSTYTVNITSNTNNKFSGNFSCTVGSKILAGTFNNLSIK